MVAALHEDVSSTYRPVEPAPDLGGALNRYTTARHEMFTTVERDTPAGEGQPGVECVYTGRFVPTGPDDEPDHDDMNCEHVWPRDRMDSDREGARYAHEQSDLHHLFPSDARTNSARGHLHFGDPVAEVVTEHAPARIGLDPRGQRVFSPRAPRRGDVARATLYFSVRWGADVGEEEEAVLRRWSEEDPPDSWERQRHEARAAVQGNRNPFVDCPELVGGIGDFRAFEVAPRDDSLPLP